MKSKNKKDPKRRQKKIQKERINCRWCIKLLIKLSTLINPTTQLEWYTQSNNLNVPSERIPFTKNCVFLNNITFHYFGMARLRDAISGSRNAYIYYWNGDSISYTPQIGWDYSEMARIGDSLKIVIGGRYSKEIYTVELNVGVGLIPSTYANDQNSEIKAVENDDLRQMTILGFYNNVIGFYDFTQTGPTGLVVIT